MTNMKRAQTTLSIRQPKTPDGRRPVPVRNPVANFDPALPLDGSLMVAGEMRSQFNGLKTLIDDIPAGPAGPQGPQGPQGGEGPAGPTGPPGSQGEAGSPGPQGAEGAQGNEGPQGAAGAQGETGQRGETGPQGPPFANAMVEAVNTLNPGEPATVSVTFDGINVRFTFGIPRGADGSQGSVGPQGPVGEVSTAQLDSAIATTASDPTAIAPYAGSFSDPPTQAEMQDFASYVESLRAALLR